MKTTTMRTIAAALALAAAACKLPDGGKDGAYTLQGDPWAAKPAGGGGTRGEGGAASAATKPDAARPDGAAAGNGKESPGGATTVLEQLEQAKAKAKALETRTQQLETDAASLTALIEQLKRENQNLAQLADATAQSRTSLDQEMEKTRQQMKETEMRCRALADDLLAERIQRVRVERELILAKVKEAEKQDDH